MKTALTRIARLSPLVAAIAAVACGPLSEPTYNVEEPAAPASLADECAAGLCVDDETLDRMAAVQAALESCVPAEEEFEPDEAEGLAIAGVDVTEIEGGWRLDVSLANTSADGVWSYPSSMLEVLEGDALVVASWDGVEVSDPVASTADVQLYGIVACSVETHSYLLSWADAADAVLIASARNNIGEDIKDSVKFALVQE